MIEQLSSRINKFLDKEKIQLSNQMNSVSSGMEYYYYTSWNNSKPGCFVVMLIGSGGDRSYRIMASDVDIEIKIKMIVDKWLEEYRENWDK